MPEGFRVKAELDEPIKLISFSVRGKIQSSALTDQLIDAHNITENAWTYNRLFDYRNAVGFYEYEDVKRLKGWWVSQKPVTAPLRKTAIVSPDALVRARINTFDASLFYQDDNRAFDTLDEALDWLQATPVPT
ncbi:MAG: STAS/SEC14 domain-containing protein [Asticcacaulis sp.]